MNKIKKVSVSTLVVSMLIFGVVFGVIFGSINILMTEKNINFKTVEFNSVSSGQMTDNTYFIKNSNEELLKKSGYMGTLAKRDQNTIIDQVDMFTVCADGGELSTKDLTFANLDYSMIEEESKSLARQVIDMKKIENNCRSVVFVNYRSKNRAKIDLKVTKTFVDGSNGLAPYAGVWDIRSDMVVSNINVGLDKHYIKAVAPLIVASSDLQRITQPITNANNATISLTESMSAAIQIEGSIEYDGRVPNIKVGASYEFAYGESKTYTFEQNSFSSIAVAFPDYNIFGNYMYGTKYKVEANAKQYIVNHQLVQRFGYFDGDSVADDLFAFVGIGGLEINGKSLAPNLTIGDIEASENVNDGNIFGIFMSWKSDNSAHSYMGEMIGLSNLIMDYSSSNLPDDLWDNSFGYGY